MHRRNPILLSLCIRSLAVCALALTSATPLGGCNSNKGSGADASPGATGNSRIGRGASRAGSDTEGVIRELDQRYVIGPTAAGELDYRIAWQFSSPSRTSIKALGARGDSVYTLDAANFLTRIGIVDGRQQWRTQAAEPFVEFVGLNVVGDRVYLTSGSEIFVFDALNGTMINRWPLEKIAGTGPLEYGSMLIYGARSGEIVWLSRQIGYMWRAYHVAHTISVQPVIKGNVIAVAGGGGRVMVLNADSATQYWSKNLLEPVVCRPVIGEGMLYVAGMDQYLWGYDLSNGHTYWRVLTNAPLTSSPTLVEDRLYQQVPGYGLTCFNAVPIDRYDGEMFWQNPRVTGNVIMAHRGDLFAWDAASRRLQVLESQRGGLKSDIELSQVEFLVVGGAEGRNLFASSADGRVVHLAPRN